MVFARSGKKATTRCFWKSKTNSRPNSYPDFYLINYVQFRARQQGKYMDNSLSNLKTEFVIGQQYPILVTLPDGEKIKGLATYENHIFGPESPGFGNITMEKPLTCYRNDDLGSHIIDDDAVIEFIWLSLTEGNSSEHTFHCGVHYKLLVD